MEVLRSTRPMDDKPYKRNATYADLEALDERLVGEIIDGDLYAHSRPRTLHASAIGELHDELSGARRDRRGGWVILMEPQIGFGKHILVPDLAGWRRSRMPEIPDVVTVRLAPDWVCEGLSPSTARLDKGRKSEIYAHHGVGHVWFVDPANHTLDILELDGTSYRVHGRRGTFPPFGLKIDLAKLWRR
jgi:Uma2 family endonuclease